jgi:hypothetical protein
MSTTSASLILTVIGDDRPGLVGELSAVISAHQGNWLESSMAQLAGKFVKAPELLAPAGSLAMARTALDFGADAIYAGQPRYSLRVRNNDFGDLENLAAGIAPTHARGKRSTWSATSCRTTPSSRPTSTTWRR